MKKLAQELDFKIDTNQEPYQTLQTLKKIRNDMAHSQPIEKDTPIKSKEQLVMEMELWSK